MAMTRAKEKPKSAPKTAKKRAAPAASEDDADVLRRDVEVVPIEETENGEVRLDPELADRIERSFEEDAPSLVPEVLGHADGEAESADRALATVDPVAAYMAEIRRYPLLTREEERELAVRYRETGDATAAQALVTANLRFVVKVAAEYSKFGAKLIDLIQEGNVGLMHAVKEFNPYKNVRLITYAVWWIRGYIQEYLMRQYSLVRIGTTQNQRKLFYRLQRERAMLDSMGQEPNLALLSSRLGVPQDEVESMAKRLSGRDVSLSQPLDANGGSTATLLDLEASEDVGVDEAIGRREELAALRANIDKIRGDLTEKELFILDNRILSDEPLTLQQIGEKYGVTREAVRQVEARLIGRIRSLVMTSLAAQASRDGAQAAADDLASDDDD